MLKVGSIIDYSSIDYPKEVATVIGLCGCPFRCPFCHNWKFFDESECKDMEITEITKMIDEYADMITGICITGGEPLYQYDNLLKLLKILKKYGKIKIDTNGFYSKHLSKLCELDLVDYFAMDIKTRIEQDEYEKMCNSNDENLINKIRHSVHILTGLYTHWKYTWGKKLGLEFRTTVVPDKNDSDKNIIEIAKFLSNYEGQFDHYVLNQFSPNNGTLEREYKNIKMIERDELMRLAKLAKNYLKNVKIRTIQNGDEEID